MKPLFKLLFLLIVINSRCTNNLSSQLEGQWMSMSDMDYPYFIFFHKSGRYIILNEFGDDNLVSIAERGDWLLVGKELILKNREFIAKFSDFRNYFGKDPLLSFKINFNQENKELELNQGKEKYIETYRRIYTFPKIIKIYSGFKPCIKKIMLPSSGARTLMKLSYKFFHYTTKECPVELIIEDQEGHVLLHRVLVFTDEIKKEEFLLADKVEVINLKELFFKIIPKENGHWELGIRIY